ncbi:MAG: winged helix-turn-helix domain-containing protein [Actinomycetota bacterium]
MRGSPADEGTRVVLVEPGNGLMETIPRLVSLGAVVVVAPNVGSALELASLVSSGHGSDGEKTPMTGLEVDAKSRLAVWEGERIPLTNLEFGVLEALSREPGRAWSFKDLRAEVWGDQNPRNGDLNAVRAVVQRLREKLTSAGTDVAVDSVRGYGFRLSREDTVTQSESNGSR